MQGVNDRRGLANNSDLYDRGVVNQQSDITNERSVSQSTLSYLNECDSFTANSDSSDPLSVDSMHNNNSAMNDKISQDQSKNENDPANKRFNDSENKPSTSKKQKLDSPLFFLEENDRRVSKKWRHETVNYNIKLNREWDGNTLGDVYVNLTNIIKQALDDLKARYHPGDLVRLFINHEDLDKPISIPLTKLSEYNSDELLSKIEAAIQSNTNLDLAKGLDLRIAVQQIPKGSGRTKINNVPKALTNKKSIVYIYNRDHLCLARSIVVCKAKLDNNVQYNTIRRGNRPMQGRLATQLHIDAGVPLDRSCTYNDIAKFEAALNLRIIVISSLPGTPVSYYGDTEYDKQIYIFHSDVDNGHFDSIVNIKGFHGYPYFCESCLVPYAQSNIHSCDLKCTVCRRPKCDKAENPKVCTDCNKLCRSQECFDAHKQIRRRGKKVYDPPCELEWKCLTFKKIHNVEDRKRDEHVCGEWKCNDCSRYVVGDHRCYLRCQGPQENINKFIFFDFECTQESGEHIPNLVVAQSVCVNCINDELKPDSVCEACGTRCVECQEKDIKTKVYIGPPCQGKCGFREQVFRGPNTQDEFGRWLFCDNHKDVTVIAHNMQSYDGIFLLNYMTKNCMKPSVVFNGAKIMFMKVHSQLNIRILDSLNFLPMRLSKLPAAFGIDELKKGYFPHFFNTEANQNYCGPYPEKSFYGYDQMSESDRDKFCKWHNEQEGRVFDFAEEILTYCRSDVDILRKACMCFRQLVISVTGDKVTDDKGNITYVRSIDPFSYFTIASVCMAIYRAKFFFENWRGITVKEAEKARIQNREPEFSDMMFVNGRFYTRIHHEWKVDVPMESKEFINTPMCRVPPSGCFQHDQFSKISICWLEWLMFCAQKRGETLYIQHAVNECEKEIHASVGDHKITYKLDGYCRETNTCFEYNGCEYHGCTTCLISRGVKQPITGRTPDEMLAVTKQKQQYITEKLKMNYVSIWGHTFQKMINENAELRLFIDQLDIQPRLNPRDAFRGGRTNACRLFYRADQNEIIQYKDVTSLYPYVMKYGIYPVGIPDIIVDRNILDDLSKFNSFFGLAFVQILPPRGLYHPVLPYSSQGKLKFPLCAKCADEEHQGNCSCSDHQRALVGTWTTIELNKATEMGYKLLKVYEVYHFTKTSQYDPITKQGGLFTSYIDAFLKIKQEASGFPDWCADDDNLKREYVKQYATKEGIDLDFDQIKKNPGLRLLAKMKLNCLWGKTAQNENMTQCTYFTDPTDYFRALTDPRKEVINFHQISEHVMLLEWRHTKSHIPSSSKTNIFVAIFTTSLARLHLYSLLEKAGRSCLYYDTDSVVYACQRDQDPLPTGDCLGQLTNELECKEIGCKIRGCTNTHFIETFVSGGPKNYAYKLDNGKEVCKVRGFTLNFLNSKLINFEAVKDIVLSNDREKLIPIEDTRKITRNKYAQTISNVEQTKNYRMVYNKRVMQNNYDTLPYGY